MGKHFPELADLLTVGKYTELLEKIDKFLSFGSNLSTQTNEERYSELIHLRIAAKALLNKEDDLVLDLIRKEKFPSEATYRIDKNKSVVLQFKNHFLVKADAYVNTVHSTELFSNTTAIGAKSEFVKRLGLEEINRQILQQNTKLKEGDFITLSHNELSAPLSYHIIYDRNYPDMEILRSGIGNVIQDAVSRKMERIVFFPLLFGLVTASPEEEKNKTAEKIAEAIAEITIGILKSLKDSISITIQFNFVKTDTMQVFDKSFYSASRYSKEYLSYVTLLKSKQKTIIDGVLTKDETYIKALTDISYSLDDNSPIIILGETGVGKTWLAKILHENSNRLQDKFQSVNCSILTPRHLVTTLFGWKKGSFSDAKEDGPGAVSLAEGGTLFLDEIGYASLEVQKMLLKFIDEKQYSRFGDPTIFNADVKLVFGTNVDLKKKVISGEFQEDLYYRITRKVLEIPPLRKRKRDICVFADYLLKLLSEKNNIRITINEEAKEFITSQYKWPGNLRQLDAYITDLFNECKKNNCIEITTEMVLCNKPDDTLFRKDDRYAELEAILQEYYNNWNPDNGNILDTLINPILAKLWYTKPLGIIKDSKKFIGYDVGSGKSSVIPDYLKQYERTKEIFSKLD
ncbi:MAG: sigma-54-dependent transcriptional regulator [Clostridiales bacterium]